MLQSTHSHGVRPPTAIGSLSQFCASIHALTWSATQLKLTSAPSMMLQSTHSHGVRPSGEGVEHAYILLQSTHSHGVRHELKKQFNASSDASIHALTWSATQSQYIMSAFIVASIHALTWSATYFLSYLSVRAVASIHALTWSATRCCLSSRVSSRSFNPRTHMECDLTSPDR